MKKEKVTRLSTRRKQAEKRLAQQPKPSKMSEQTIASLIHELQIHQIELEIQNEQLLQAQAIIENSKKRYSDLYDFAPVGYLTVEKEGIIVEANLTAAGLLGIEKSNLVNKPFNHFVHPEDQDVFYMHLISLHKNVSETCEIRLKNRREDFFHAELVSTPLVDDSGASSKFLIAVLEITARKRAEEAHARLATIVENSYDAIFSKTLDGLIESWNASAQRMYGFTEKEIMGQSASILAPPDCTGEMADFLRKIKAGESVRDFETIRRKKDGTDIPVSLTVSPVKTPSGDIIGASIITKDITSQKQWEQSILDLNERLLVSNQELEGLGHMLSHDLRGPIQGIELLAGVLLEGHAEKLEPKGKRMLETVFESAQRMSAMISGLLEISRIARSEIRREKIDLTALANAIVQEYKAAEPLRDAEVSVQENLSAEGDADLLRIALDNLIRNAWKFTGKRPKARIEFGKTNSPGKEIFFLRDNGAGFDMKYANKMFAVFQRLHSESEFKGTGVGLAMVQRIIRRHGGEIRAEGEIDKGATFYFSLQ
jgi:PAS domain S-box-containing protein